MKKVITIGEKDVELVANAASPYVYKQIFREDFLRKMQEKEPDLETIQRICFVMVKQAELSTSDLLKLAIEDYLAWLEDFEPMDILNAGEDITTAYFGQTKGTSVPKKQGV